MVAALSRAITLAERDHIALAIAKQLHLDMTCAGDIGLEKHAAVTEVALAQTFD
ncbi:hypothetical protein HORIV_24980 [Vreelandella olivaria]|uniref:Uncharacterized protein n=1 Tax=Vreelandella olivaria TaxID=390919 RepID=A0ABM7GHH5_9GAMM|nr:hypothetical protein HORIV_24980 [Halomonas olivaria]